MVMKLLYICSFSSSRNCCKI